MAKIFLVFLLTFFTVHSGQAQTVVPNDASFHRQNFGMQAGLVLLGNPFVLYPSVSLSYSQTLVGQRQHQVAVLSQIGLMLLPDIENKFLFSAAVQHKYVGKGRLEASIFLGLNYQLRRLAYDRYAFEDNTLVNKGRTRHQFGPTVGMTVGYKIIKKQTFSISPFLGFSLTQLNKNYTPNLFAGYKPNLTIGVNFNK